MQVNGKSQKFKLNFLIRVKKQECFNQRRSCLDDDLSAEVKRNECSFSSMSFKGGILDEKSKGNERLHILLVGIGRKNRPHGHRS